MEVSRTTQWRLISGVFGAIALVLMVILGILLKSTFTVPNNQPMQSPGPTTEPKEGSGCCGCPEKWIGFQCNCYFISHDKKTWAESREFCVSQNSSLLQLQNRDELRFMSSSDYFYWVGFSYSKEHDSQMWEKVPVLIQDRVSFTKRLSTGACVLYRPAKTILDEPCTKSNYFICKQQLI